MERILCSGLQAERARWNNLDNKKKENLANHDPNYLLPELNSLVILSVSVCISYSLTYSKWLHHIALRQYEQNYTADGTMITGKTLECVARKIL